jgi:protein-disulfide isomerase/uncharacterized membrane protein
MNKKTLTLNGFTIPNTIYLLLSLAMIGVSAYLMSHFYTTFFPTGFGGEDSLCSGTGFWGCDKATTSVMGKVFNVPTAFFGIIIGLLGVLGAIFPSEKMESTNKFFIIINAVGCVALLVYSLISLGGLCPFCTIYYALSILAAVVFTKSSELKAMPDVKITAFYAVIVIAPSIFMNMNFTKRMNTLESLSKQYVEQYKGLKDQGVPSYESPYKLHIATEKFADAPIRISVFSDFQCPFCQRVADQMPEIIKGMEDKVNIQYFFYPLDSACNPKMKRSFHAYACRASYLAACDAKQFAKIHDFLFANQEKLGVENLNKWEKDFGLSGCFDNPELKDEIVRSMNIGTQYNLKSTPTIIINGKKIEGSIPTVHFQAIIKSLIK